MSILDLIRQLNLYELPFVLVNSIIHIIPEILSIDGVKYVLTDKFNQDPIEEHFGKQR